MKGDGRGKNDSITWSFSIKPTKADRSISMGWPERSYRAMTKWKKLDLRKFDGGCFSKWARPTPNLRKKKRKLHNHVTLDIRCKWHSDKVGARSKGQPSVVTHHPPKRHTKRLYSDTKIGKFSWKSRRFARPTLKCWPWPATKQWRSVARSTEKIGRNHFPFPRNEWTVSGERNFVETCGNGLCLSWIELTYALWSTMAAGIQPLEANGRPMLAEKSTLRSGCICDDDGWWSCIRWPSTDVTKVKM